MLKIKWGNRNTQDYKVAAYLNSGADLTPLSAANNLDGVQRLAARIMTINCNLLAYGYAQITNTIKRTANGRHYSSYRGTVPESVLAIL